jgi:uncharacterized membrane protein
MLPADWAALAFYLAVWLGYDPLLRRMAKASTVLQTDLEALRDIWMRGMATRRDTRLLDGQLLGHVITSASFFTSSNLILTAGVAGVLFGGYATLGKANEIGVAAQSLLLFQGKIALVLAALARGLLSFIWAIRQMNYCVALIGAAPDSDADPVLLRAYAEAARDVLNPALAAFSGGIRAYYFAMAAGAWLFGPVLLAMGTLAAFIMLIYRQSSSRSARGLRKARALLDE